MKFVTLLFLVFSLSCFSQPTPADLPGLAIFRNPAEKKIFDSIKTGNRIDYLSLYLVADARIGNDNNILGKAKDRISQFAHSEDITKLKMNANAKALKKLYKSIHDEFLSKYTDNPSFSELFETGTYNCATASALYVLLLDELSIPYTIRETPTHVYLIVSPGQNDVVFETTTPGATTLEINEKMKTQYLEYLYKNKLISKEEWTTKSPDELFQQYFYNDEAVNPRQLAGILYYNRGIGDMMKENYTGAYTNFEKAFFLYPHEKMRYFVSASIVYHLATIKPADDENAGDYFIRYLQLGNQDLGGKMVVEYLEATAEKHLFKNPDHAKYLRIYHSIHAGITDTALVKEVDRVHYYHTARYYSMKNQYDSAGIYLDSVYSLNKNDLLIKELITSVTGNYLQSFIMTDHGVDTVTKYFKKYPFLESNPRLRELYIYCLAWEISEYYKKDKQKEAAVYLDAMKEVLTKETALAKRSEQFLTAAIIEIYHYYVRKRKYQDAKSFLQYADKHLPGNEEIARRLKRIDDIIQNQ